MQLDAGRMPENSVLDAELCVIGAGPAGLALVREFVGLDTEVLLLESGGRDSEEWPQSLNEGRVVGDEYFGLRPTRHRGAGGTSALWNTPFGREWGAKYVPLDAWDFDPAPGDGPTGWPIRHESLLPWYHRAQAVCGLGPFGYDALDWETPERPPLAGASDALATRVYQFGSRAPFTAMYPEQFRAAANLRVCYHATVCRLVTDASGARIVAAEVLAPDRRSLTVRARVFVIAAGAIENARLLLMSRLGGERVGRCFMEHPRDHALTLVPDSPEAFARAAFYDAHRTGDGFLIGGRLALTGEAVRGGGLPNASVTLLPRLRASSPVRGLLPRLARRLRDAVNPPPMGGYGWADVPDPARHFDGFRLLVNFEQRPHPENRITLDTDADGLGVPRPLLHWRWRHEEQTGLVRLRETLARSLESAGLGRVQVDGSRAPDPNAHHHAGTTRMALDPRDGVVDADLRVHGIGNLYAAGASVFPTAGFANPTLTVVALAVRLADHLKTEAKRLWR